MRARKQSKVEDYMHRPPPSALAGQKASSKRATCAHLGRNLILYTSAIGGVRKIGKP